MCPIRSLGCLLSRGARELFQGHLLGLSEPRPLISRDAIPLRPGPDGMNRQAALGRDNPSPDRSDNFPMRSHEGSMHYARPMRKCLLHSGTDYNGLMQTASERLRKAREKHFPSAAAAAMAMGIPVGTYAGHENGHRGFPKDRAPTYAKKFKVSEEWLLYGKGDEQAFDPIPDEQTLISMVQEVIDSEVRLGTLISDLPRIVGPALRKQLELHADHAKVAAISDAATARDRRAQAPAPTKAGDREGSRTA